MKVTRIPLTDNETLEVQRFVTGAAHIGVTRKNEAAGVHVVEYVYALDSIQREQLREALK